MERKLPISVDVLGDVITDVWVRTSESGGTSDELGPRPVRVESTAELMGGAGNTFRVLRSLGVMGADLVDRRSRATKTRYLDEELRTTLRADSEGPVRPGADTRRVRRHADVVIAVDYGKGCFLEETDASLMALRDRLRFPVIAHSKRRPDSALVKLADVVTCNSSEYEAGRSYYDDVNCLLVTYKNICYLYRRGTIVGLLHLSHWQKSHAVLPINTVGAGDSFMAGVALGIILNATRLSIHPLTYVAEFGGTPDFMGTVRLAAGVATIFCRTLPWNNISTRDLLSLPELDKDVIDMSQYGIVRKP